MKNQLFVLVVLFAAQTCVLGYGEHENFTEFINYVKSNIDAARSYVIPTDNEDLVHVTYPDIQSYGNFDFIIIGSGASGAVIANRLSEIADWNVLLLEAGGPATNFTKIMGLSYYNFFSDRSWGYNTTEQKNACLGMQENRCFVPTGKVLGGGTSIGEGLYVRGHSEDYDRWDTVYGNPGWTYEEVLPYFKKSENANFDLKMEIYHGENGYFNIEQGSENQGLDYLLFESGEEIDIYEIIDCNGIRPFGTSRVQSSLHGNERVSAATAFLDNFTNRTNLNISTHSFVTKILIDNSNKTANGVEFVKNGVKYVATANKEVIVSAGAINSAQLLMLSGIGPKNHLEQLNISVVADLPVGRRFQDHLVYTGVVFRTNQFLYDQNLEDLLHLYVNHLRPLTVGLNSELISFPSIKGNGTERPEIVNIFSTPAMDSSLAQFILRLDDEHAAQFKTNTTSDLWVPIILLHPQSVGSVTLQSNDPKDKPLIDPNFLSDEEGHDLETLYRAIEVLQQFEATPTFQANLIKLVAFDTPGCTDEKYSRDWWVCSFKHWSTSIHHPASTCAMGPNPESSVVDPTLHVHGVNGLRVADGGVLPELNSGYLYPPVMMIGEKVSDLIKEEYGV